MAQNNKKPAENPTFHHSSMAASVANTFEWLITAFVLAFIFRAFVLEAFRIPTGSMAETLNGDYYRIRCTQCGYRYDYGHDMQRRDQQRLADGKVVLNPVPRCPSCGNYEQPGTAVHKSNGDRILVLKCIYQFTEPKRWDVVVFKNPTEPYINYIKRMIAGPGETVEIVDGDIYINGTIARKPKMVQEEMWMPIYLNDYQPARPEDTRFNSHSFRQPFRNAQGSGWTFDRDKPTVFRLESQDSSINMMYYVHSRENNGGNDFKAAYAYGSPEFFERLPYCSDLMIRFGCIIGEKSMLGAGLGKYGIFYRGVLADANQPGRKKMVIQQSLGENDEYITLAQQEIDSPKAGELTDFEFANVDHLLIFKIGSEKLTFDLGDKKDSLDTSKRLISPQVYVMGSGNLELRHLGLYRDTHYLDSPIGARSDESNGGEGHPFTLEKDQFFVLGDNSPGSFDCRAWQAMGLGNNGTKYRAGTVPRDYLVGKAFYVYWPSGFRLPGPFSKTAIVPNVGKMRFIYGGG